MDDEFPKLILLDWQEGDDELIKAKGWFCHNQVELANGNRYTEVTIENMKKAIIEAEKQKFFENLKPIENNLWNK